MQAIITTYLAPTNTKGSRISAKCERGTIIIGYDYDGDQEAAHIAAASALVAKFIAEDAEKYGTDAARANRGWGKPRACGQLPSGSYAHVFIA